MQQLFVGLSYLIPYGNSLMKSKVILVFVTTPLLQVAA